jgi:hypothetical protein
VSFHPRPPKKSEGTATFPKDFELEEVAAVTDRYLRAYPLNNRNEFDKQLRLASDEQPLCKGFHGADHNPGEACGDNYERLFAEEVFGMRYLRKRRLQYRTACPMRVRDVGDRAAAVTNRGINSVCQRSMNSGLSMN